MGTDFSVPTRHAFERPLYLNVDRAVRPHCALPLIATHASKGDGLLCPQTLTLQPSAISLRWTELSVPFAFLIPCQSI
jgi:hypothetical protein